MLLLLLGLAQAAHAAPFHYYYSVAETDAPGWEYVFPACQKLAAADYEKMSRDCTRLDSVSEKCTTDKTVNLKHVPVKADSATAPVPVPKTDADVQKVDDTTKTFRLSYVVFVSEKQCRETREAAMKSITR